MKSTRQNDVLSLIAIAAVALILRLPYVRFPVLNLDETIYATIAREILHGAVPYRDIWEIKPPLIFYLYAIIFRLFGDASLTPVHVAAALSMALTALVAADIARREWGRVAGLLAGLGIAAYSTAARIADVQAAETELFLLLPLALGIRFFLIGSGRHTYRNLFLAGFFTCAAAMFKQPAAGVAVLMCVWLLFLPPEGHPRLRVAGFFAAGIFALPMVFGRYFLDRAALGDAFNLAVINNFRYIGERGQGNPLYIMAVTSWRIAGPNIVLWLMAFGFAVFAVIRSFGKNHTEADRRNLFLALFLMVSALGTFSGVSVNGHYYLIMVPGLVLMWTWGVVYLWARFKAKAQKIVLIIIIIAGLAFPLFHFHITGRRWFMDHQVNPNEAYSKLCQAIRSMTQPDDRIFMWGINPEIYFYSNRRPAGRFIYTTFQVGMVVNTPSAATGKGSGYAMPESWNLLMQDLETYKPKVFIDAAGADPRFGKYPIGNYPRLTQWLNAGYSPEYTFGGYIIYVRK